jgi:hypothetical protein
MTQKTEKKNPIETDETLILGDPIQFLQKHTLVTKKDLKKTQKTYKNLGTAVYLR